jgi:hypothetical protein
LTIEKAIQRNTTHNMIDHPAYRAWIQLKSRCLNKKCPEYIRYGARGIKVCERWVNSFENFWEDMGPTWKKRYSIERFDVNRGYEPSNCGWATSKEQANNRRTNHIIETPEGKMTLTMAAEKFGISPITIHSRIRYGWPHKDLFKPVGYRR